MTTRQTADETRREWGPFRIALEAIEANGSVPAWAVYGPGLRGRKKIEMIELHDGIEDAIYAATRYFREWALEEIRDGIGCIKDVDALAEIVALVHERT